MLSTDEPTISLDDLLAQIARLNEDSHGEALETPVEPMDSAFAIDVDAPSTFARPLARFTLCSTGPRELGSVCHTPTTTVASLRSYPSTPAVIAAAPHKGSTPQDGTPTHQAPPLTPFRTPSRSEDRGVPPHPHTHHHHHPPATPTVRLGVRLGSTPPPHRPASAVTPLYSVEADGGPCSPVAMACDPHGAHALQATLEGLLWGSPEVQRIVDAIHPCAAQLLRDPFGAAVVVSMLDAAPQGARHSLLRSVVPHMVAACSAPHGVATLTHLVDGVSHTVDFGILVDALGGHAEALLSDPQGYHIILHTLARSSNPNHAAAVARMAHAIVDTTATVATHRQGCCSLQKCLEWSMAHPRIFDAFADVIVAHVATLATHQFGNYVVQLLLDKCTDTHHRAFRTHASRVRPLGDFVCAMAAVVADHIVSLSCNKFSSNVVERLLRRGGEEAAATIITSLVHPTAMASIAQNSFGNYVVQTALREGPLSHLPALVDAVRTAMPVVRCHHFARKVDARLDEAAARMRASKVTSHGPSTPARYTPPTGV